jgi:4-diphosphocytidyl-2-C-methyl-D-erythritol kinase
MSRESASITLAAPAKINLSLRILGKRPDGFHEIKTLIAPIVLADQIEISHAADERIGFLCNDPEIPGGTDNLCVKAAEAFLATTGLDHGIRISLMKKIPHGAGLGGGSSDAAAVLKGLNELFDHPLVTGELHQIASMLGSDVPFFLHDGPAWSRGRGEILEEAPPLPARTILLIKPPFPVPTAWAYRHYAGMKESGAFLPDERRQRFAEIEIANDLEPPVFHKYLLLPVMKEWLLEQAGVECAFMTGSGSTMVAVIKQGTGPDEIPTLKRRILSEFGETMWICETGWWSVSGEGGMENPRG